MDAKKLMNQKNYIMKHNKITEMEVEEKQENYKQVREVTKKRRRTA
jgi:translation initiation factor 2 gamma subunit (eIF-2gamma)